MVKQSKASQSDTSHSKALSTHCRSLLQSRTVQQSRIISTASHGCPHRRLLPCAQPCDFAACGFVASACVDGVLRSRMRLCRTVKLCRKAPMYMWTSVNTACYRQSDQLRDRRIKIMLCFFSCILLVKLYLFLSCMYVCMFVFYATTYVVNKDYQYLTR